METLVQPATPSPPSRAAHGDLTRWAFLVGAAACVMIGWLRQARLAH
jgi:hypothetical protein